MVYGKIGDLFIGYVFIIVFFMIDIFCWGIVCFYYYVIVVIVYVDGFFFLFYYFNIVIS